MHSTASSPTVEGTHRRRLLITAGTGLGAAAIAGAIGPLGHLLPAAAASSEESPEIALASFLTGIELAVVDLYDLAGKSGKLTGDLAALAKTFGQHHQVHGEKLGALVTDGGGTAPTTGNVGLDRAGVPQDLRSCRRHRARQRARCARGLAGRHLPRGAARVRLERARLDRGPDPSRRRPAGGGVVGGDQPWGHASAPTGGERGATPADHGRCTHHRFLRGESRPTTTTGAAS